MRLTFTEIQRNLNEIANRQSYTKDVLFELMAAYGRSSSSITKLRSGNSNLAPNKETTVLQKGVVYFKSVNTTNSLPAEVEKLEHDPLTVRYNPRFLIATNLKAFAAKDTKKGNTLEIKWEDIDRNVDFFYGWTGDEVVDAKTEAAADRRAADKMKELYYEVEKVNADCLDQKKSSFRHELNVFFTRLLFCFFAEDTRVFSNEDKSLFTSSIREFTQTDGSDLDQFLGTLFEALDAKDKSSYTSPFSNFPYVNGSLFDKTKGITIPKFNAQSRKLILDCGALSWAEINPDIFGSMFQSIVDEEVRETHGMHYTSVPNIMKTIEPLFLDKLREEFDDNYDNDKKLEQLWDRISKIKVFDPACGSGNFLIIAHKELRKLEHAIIERLFEKKSTIANIASRINLDNFYGIEIDDFACEVAILSLYIAKHQMNIEFEKQFGKRIGLIPLDDKANIVKANAARIDWQEVCPNKPRSTSAPNIKQTKLIPDEYEQKELIDIRGNEMWDEIYLISNPPYVGTSLQSEYQKKDMKTVLADLNNYKNLDYIGIWIKKGADYIKGSKSELALVSTNSITQGQQVSLLWPYIFENSIEISFAFTSFKWSNLARSGAGVTCVVIGLRNKNKEKKLLYDGYTVKKVNNINPYLAEGSNIIINKRTSQISGLPQMSYGSKPVDGGNLILNKMEMESLSSYNVTKEFIKTCLGGQELLYSERKWCIWINPEDFSRADNIPVLRQRFEAVRKFRLNSKKAATRKFAEKPYAFGEVRYKNLPYIALPSVSSENREYIPMVYITDGTVTTNTTHLAIGAPLYLFSILNSKMHSVWTWAITGRLRSDINYSSTIVYNNFPVPFIDKAHIQKLEISGREILLTRENHSEKTLAELYDPNKMPADLREAHHRNDILVDRLYRLKPYENDEERLADLFALYEKMIAEEKKK